MRNLYRKTARVTFTAPRLDGCVNTDVVVIGGGYTGISTALHLAELGISCVVLEANTVGHGGSGRNGGQVNPGLKLLPYETELHYGKERGMRLLALASGAPDEVFQLIDNHGIDCSPVRFGTVCAAIDPAGLRRVRAMATQSQSRGGPVGLLDAQEMQRRTGTYIYLGGAIDPRGGHINPLAYSKGLALAAQRAGAQLYENSAVESLHHQAGIWNIKTSDGMVRAPELVICTNGYTGDLWPGLRQTILPLYTYITATEPLPEQIRRTIVPSQVSVYEAAWDVVYYRVDREGRLLMGGRGVQRPAADPKDYQHLIQYAEKLWPQLKNVSWPWHWYGQVAMTNDHFPRLTVPEPGVHLMLGYNGRGIAMATVAGRLIAQRIAFGGTVDIALPVHRALTPIPFHRFWKVGANAAMGWHILKDKIRGK